MLARDGSTLAEAPSEANKLLEQFQFSKERWNERIRMLSGGERRRLQLLSVLTQRPNFLILDEPVSLFLPLSETYLTIQPSLCISLSNVNLLLCVSD